MEIGEVSGISEAAPIAAAGADCRGAVDIGDGEDLAGVDAGAERRDGLRAEGQRGVGIAEPGLPAGEVAAVEQGPRRTGRPRQVASRKCCGPAGGSPATIAACCGVICAAAAPASSKAAAAKVPLRIASPPFSSGRMA